MNSPRRLGAPAPLAALLLSAALGLAGCADSGLHEDVMVIDRGMMAEIPCHEMGGIIMGDCSEEEIAKVFAQMELDPARTIVYDKQLRAGEACTAEGLTISGDCSEEDLARVEAEIRAAQ